MNVITRKEAKGLGLKTYFSGKKCPHGHLAERRVDSCVCCQCNRLNCVSYKSKNPDKIKTYNNEYHAEHREENKIRCFLYRKTHKETIRIQNRKWVTINRKKHNQNNNARAKQRRKEDLGYKLGCYLRSRTTEAVRGNWKNGSVVKDLGCTIEELRHYIESKFQYGMTWDNWSVSGWHIDHVIPLASFNLADRTQFLKAAHYTNLQPLWAKDNLRKGNHVI